MKRRLSILQPFFRKLELDRAVFFGISSKLWSFIAGPISVVLITSYFSPPLQGYYYTFGALLALQTFAEFGLGVVIVQFVSHEWSKLGFNEKGEIIGDSDALSRLSSIASIAMKWYVVGGVICIFGLGIGGFIFFSGSHEITHGWIAPWFALCILTGLNMCLIPIWSLLEGSNQVSNLYRYRFTVGIIANVVTWIAIWRGAGLWTTTFASGVTLLYASIFLRKKYWHFLKTLFLTKVAGPKLSWRVDILPMQFRIAISWIFGYFGFSLFTPILFKFSGPAMAGQMGLSWAFIGLIGAISNSWVAPRVPQFGMLIAQKKYTELDSLFWRVTKVSFFLTLLIGVAMWLFIILLNHLHYPLAVQFSSRLLPSPTIGVFLIAQILQGSLTPFTSYLLAHKKNPVLFPSMVFGLLSAFSTYFLGKYFSAIGMALGYLGVNLIIVPWVFIIWFRCRKAWHA
jgi:O-antigen/teichoic acid export membrane protein